MKKTLFLALAVTTFTLAGCADETPADVDTTVIEQPAMPEADPMMADSSAMMDDGSMMADSSSMMEGETMEGETMADSTHM